LYLFAKNVRHYEFHPRVRRSNICGGNCNVKAEFFSIHKNGKAKILFKTLKKLHQERINYGLLAHVGIAASENTDSDQLLIASLRYYHLGGEVIKKCLLCVYPGTRRQSVIWCHAKSQRVSNSAAITCSSYMPVNNHSEAKMVEVQGLEARRLRGRS
jgi:hypothetical protein